MKKYGFVFKEEKDLGIIEEVSESSALGETHYIPHHLVIRDDHSTTKLRIVFDVSSKTDGPSVNNCLYKEPQMTSLIYDILLRFRTFVYALTAGIEKAFLQISIDKDHRNFIRFLWFDDVFSNEPTIVPNRFARVAFGVTSSTLLLNGVIRKYVGQYNFDNEFVQKVIDSFYVDNFSGGANSLEGVYELFKELKLRFIDGVFNLRKWRTNEPNLRKIIGDENPSSKVLGIVWNEKDDTLSFNSQEICDLAQQLKPTKRNILKILSMFYDPTRILQPVIINLKIIFQNICKQKILWDNELPIDIANYWAIKKNQESIDNKQIELLWKQLNVTRDENNLLICTGRLKNAPLPYESKSPHLINRHRKLAELIVTDIHIKLKHISIKQTLTEVRQQFWICSGRIFIRNIVSKFSLCKRFQGPCYSYRITPPLTNLQLKDNYAFYASGVDNFGSLYGKDTFDKNVTCHP